MCDYLFASVHICKMQLFGLMLIILIYGVKVTDRFPCNDYRGRLGIHGIITMLLQNSYELMWICLKK